MMFQASRAMLVKRSVAALALGLFFMPVAADAQWTVANADPPQSTPLRLGPLALAPSIAVTNLGWDSDVFQEGGESAGDFTATTTPQVQGWMRLGQARIRGRGAVAFTYFQTYASERSTDTDFAGRLDWRLARVTPYVSGRWVNAKQRFGFEVDDRIRRRETTGTGGVNVAVGARTTVDVSGGRTEFRYDHSAEPQDPFVSEFDDYTSDGGSLEVEHELTALTSMSVTMYGSQDRFDEAPERDTDRVGINAGLELRPFALVSGGIYVGWLRMDLVESTGSSFSGLVTYGNLGYTLLGTTRFTVEVQRDVQYSAIRNQQAYLLAGVSGSVNHRLGDTWDIGARTGRHKMSYGLFESSDGESGALTGVTEEIVTDYGGEVGCRLAPNLRVGFGVRKQDRHSTVDAIRGYDRTVVGMSLNYVF